MCKPLLTFYHFLHRHILQVHSLAELNFRNFYFLSMIDYSNYRPHDIMQKTHLQGKSLPRKMQSAFFNHNIIFLFDDIAWYWLLFLNVKAVFPVLCVVSK